VRSAKDWVSRQSILVFGIALVALTVDQASKILALGTLTPRTRVDFLGDMLGWYLTFNDSAAFSIGVGATWIFTLISSIAVLSLIWFVPRIRTTGWAIMAGFLLGGVAGNLVDRLTRAPGFPNGQVVDFIQIPFDFPIFNFADCCVTVVMAIVVIRIFRGETIGGASASKPQGESK
jgi:signal peptidase II